MWLLTPHSSYLDSHVYSSCNEGLKSIIIGLSPYLSILGVSAGVGEKMGVVERVVMRLHQEREELYKTMEDFSLTAHQWSDIEEQQLSHSIKKLASCMEHCATAVSDLVSLHTSPKFLLSAICSYVEIFYSLEYCQCVLTVDGFQRVPALYSFRSGKSDSFFLFPSLSLSSVPSAPSPNTRLPPFNTLHGILFL
jgi:hypothetical protein